MKILNIDFEEHLSITIFLLIGLGLVALFLTGSMILQRLNISQPGPLPTQHTPSIEDFTYVNRTPLIFY